MSRQRVAVDLFAGTGGGTAAFRRRGWHVITIDSDPQHDPDIVADIATLRWDLDTPVDLVWASPPCTEFSRWQLRGMRPEFRDRVPSLDLLRATIRLIDEIKPRYWVIENVRGACGWFEPLLGRHRARVGPFFLWGEFPAFEPPALDPHYKSGKSGRDRVGRAHVPYALSRALAEAVTNDLRR